MVLHLDTAKEPSLQNLIGFVEVKPRPAVLYETYRTYCKTLEFGLFYTNPI